MPSMSTVVVTGASMGIGRALALAWAARGSTLILSARSADALAEVAQEVERIGGRAIVVPGDVTEPAYRKALVARAEEAGGLDVLVNNAGRGYYAKISTIDVDAMRALFDLNVFAPLALSQLAMPLLAARKGTVVMVSSVAGFVAAPKYGAYAASKFALEGLSMAMRAEVAELGVGVVVVRPGPVATPFRSNAARGAGETGYTKPDPKAQSAEDVAARTLRAVDRRRPVAETSAFVRFASTVSRLSPAAMRFALARMAKRPSEEA
jgi:short-subunit dehydrogenase